MFIYIFYKKMTIISYTRLKKKKQKL